MIVSEKVFKGTKRIAKKWLLPFLSAMKPRPLVPAGESFSEYSGNADFDRTLTMNSPMKTVFLPDSGVSFRFSSGKVIPAEKAKQTIIFGVHPLDIRALETLDKVFSKVPSYAARRNAATVVGIGDFAKSGSSFDLFLHDEGLDYLAIVGSEKGKALLAKHAKFFRSGPAQVVVRASSPFWDKTLGEDPEKTRMAVKNADPSVWEEVSRTCLGCGICSYVCPLCYCFEVEDRVPIGTKRGARCTRWDSCMLASFSEVAGGHVFQKTLQARIRAWYFHKFARATRERGKPDCVGCNRCFQFCPVGINFREVLKNAAANPRKGN